jgi:hypothetical protein
LITGIPLKRDSRADSVSTSVFNRAGPKDPTKRLKLLLPNEA